VEILTIKKFITKSQSQIFRAARGFLFMKEELALRRAGVHAGRVQQ
jgi:hypothetical protein